MQYTLRRLLHLIFTLALQNYIIDSISEYKQGHHTCRISLVKLLIALPSSKVPGLDDKLHNHNHRHQEAEMQKVKIID